jgi:DNA-binding NarL/FixJ family response regulator
MSSLEVLVIRSPGSARGIDTLVTTLCALAHVAYEPADSALCLLRSAQFDLTVVDESSASDVWSLVTRIRLTAPRTRILITTPCPSWRDAREAFRRGAIDYLGRDVPPTGLAAELSDLIGSIIQSGTPRSS